MSNTTPAWMAQGYPHIWLPYAQMKTAAPPLPVVRSHGSLLELADGRTLIDGVAAWWTACHGYNHPHIAQAVREQLDRMPHVMFGGLAHEPALNLASRLSALLGPGLERVFYTDSGSVAVEVAMKMAVQFWLNQGERGRTRFVAFRGGYHGDTFGTMAVCDPDEGMHAMFRGLLPEHDVLALPRDEAALAALQAHLERHAGRIAGMLVEPLVQGAGGMLLHDPQVLARLRELADRYGILLIFDEIFTGFGRTGTMFAFEQAGVRPDIVTLSKALTGGTLPLAATVASARLRGVLVRRPRPCADARPDLHGLRAGLRGGQRLARPVRARTAAAAGRGAGAGAARRAGALPRPALGARCAGAGRHRRDRARRHRRARRPQAPPGRSRGVGAAFRQHRVPDAGLHHCRGRIAGAAGGGAAGRGRTPPLAVNCQ